MPLKFGAASGSVQIRSTIVIIAAVGDSILICPPPGDLAKI
jgi:hypothetical protein